MYHHFYFSYGSTNEEKPEWRKRKRTEETTEPSRRRKKELNFVTFHVADNFYDVLYDGVTGAFPEVNAPEFAYSLSFTLLACCVHVSAFPFYVRVHVYVRIYFYVSLVRTYLRVYRRIIRRHGQRRAFQTSRSQI